MPWSVLRWQGHARRGRGNVPESRLLVQGPAGWIRQQGDPRLLGRARANLFHQTVENTAPQPLSLVVGQDGHVGDVEVPAAVADDAAHAHGLAGTSVPHVNRVPRTGYSP